MTGPGDGAVLVGSGPPEAEPSLSAAPEGGGFGKMILFLLLAVAVAAALGFFLSSGVG